jgi:integrase
MAFVPSEQDLLIESASGPWCLGMFLDVAADTGARRGEVLALRRSDIVDGYATIERSLTQTKEGVVFKSTKTERPRRVELPASTLAKLEEHYKRLDEHRREQGPAYRADLDLIFCNPDGTPLKPDSVSATVSSLCRRLGLPKGASLHVLRHSHASVLLANGVDLATVSERLGHSSVRVTAEIYSHAIRGRDREAADLWDQIKGREGATRQTATGVN